MYVDVKMNRGKMTNNVENNVKANPFKIPQTFHGLTYLGQVPTFNKDYRSEIKNDALLLNGKTLENEGRS